MVARYAAPISYNFLNLINIGGDRKTVFEKVFYCCLQLYLLFNNYDVVLYE